MCRECRESVSRDEFPVLVLVLVAVIDAMVLVGMAAIAVREFGP